MISPVSGTGDSRLPRVSLILIVAAPTAATEHLALAEPSNSLQANT